MPGLQLTRTLRHKVPEIVVLFWVVKLLSTAMGEAFSDLTISRIDVPADQRAVESGGAESS